MPLSARLAHSLLRRHAGSGMLVRVHNVGSGSLCPSVRQLSSIITGPARDKQLSVLRTACNAKYVAVNHVRKQSNSTRNAPSPNDKESIGLSAPQGIHKGQVTSSHENIYTVPNVLTFSRIVAAPFIGYLIVQDYNAWAVGLLSYAAVTDALDGWIARKWNQKTVVGTIIDPMADKILMTSLTICLAVKGTLPVWLAVIILGRDVALAFAAVYYRWISLPPPKTFARYWDFSLPSAEVRPTTISKYNTFLQLALVGSMTVMPLVDLDIGLYLTALQYTVAITTVWSGLSYVFSNNAVKILHASSKSSR